MGMVPTYDVRSTASRYSSCSTPTFCCLPSIYINKDEPHLYTNISEFKGGGDSFLFIYSIFLPVLVFLYSIFVCDSASEFGAMGSTSFLGFSFSNLLVFLNLLCFRNLFIYYFSLPVLVFLYSIFCLTQLPSLERWALLPFWGFPHLYTNSKFI